MGPCRRGKTNVVGLALECSYHYHLLDLNTQDFRGPFLCDRSLDGFPTSINRCLRFNVCNLCDGKLTHPGLSSSSNTQNDAAVSCQTGRAVVAKSEDEMDGLPAGILRDREYGFAGGGVLDFRFAHIGARRCRSSCRCSSTCRLHRRTSNSRDTEAR